MSVISGACRPTPNVTQAARHSSQAWSRYESEIKDLDEILISADYAQITTRSL